MSKPKREKYSHHTAHCTCHWALQDALAALRSIPEPPDVNGSTAQDRINYCITMQICLANLHAVLAKYRRPVSSDRKVQTPERGGAKSVENETPPSTTEGAKQAGAATTGSPICETTVTNPNSAAPATTYGHAEFAYLSRISNGGIEG